MERHRSYGVNDEARNDFMSAHDAESACALYASGMLNSRPIPVGFGVGEAVLRPG